MKKKVRILSIDGGGIKGIIPAYIIKYAENYLQKKHREQVLPITLILLQVRVQEVY
tara:strand:- start:241 stop:408 length:168 start_codon:yes stop_codon:yes gene_type:complete